MTKISVLMPVYNTPGNYLREAVESILAQTCADFEFLILKVASTDDKAEKVIKSYDDKRIRYWAERQRPLHFVVEKQIDRSFPGRILGGF